MRFLTFLVLFLLECSFLSMFWACTNCIKVLHVYSGRPTTQMAQFFLIYERKLIRNLLRAKSRNFRAMDLIWAWTYVKLHFGKYTASIVVQLAIKCGFWTWLRWLWRAEQQHSLLVCYSLTDLGFVERGKPAFGFSVSSCQERVFRLLRFGLENVKYKIVWLLVRWQWSNWCARRVNFETISARTWKFCACWTKQHFATSE